MPNNQSENFQVDAAFKASQSIAFTDTDKSNFEENNSFNHLIDANDVFVDTITYNNPAVSVAAFIVASGLVQFTDDVTSGDEFRTYYLSGITNIIHQKKYGNNYAPCFFYSSGLTTIYDGDFYKYSSVDWKNGYISIERNAVTDTWIEPITFDGFWYIGQTLSDITIGGGGGSNSGVVIRDESTLINASASTLNFVGTNVTATSSGASSVNITVGGVTSAELNASGNILWNRDVNLQNHINTLSGNLINSGNILTAQISNVQSNLNASGNLLLNLINANNNPTLTVNNEGALVQSGVSIINFIGENVNAQLVSGVVNVTVGGVTSAELNASGNILWNRDIALQSQISVTSGDIVNRIPITKAGSVTGSSFAGNPKTYSLVFITAFSDANYSLSVISTANRSWSVSNVVSSGVVINSNSNSLLTGETIYWTAMRHGEKP